MRKILFGFAVAGLMLGLGAMSAQAQTTRGAAAIPGATQNYTPIEKAACGPRRGPWCGPFTHRVCNRWGRCWCAPC